MKQILQNLGTGATEIIETPCPQIKKGHILIKTTMSLISTGTEKTAIAQSQQNIIHKVLRQPQKIRKAWDLFKTEGLDSTMGAIKKQFDFPITMGYSNVGVIVGLGSDVTDFCLGERVLSNGPHSEIVNVPKNLCAKIPDTVTNECASFGVLASIGLQGVRLVQPTLGEIVVVMGLGVIGLLTVQILKANGCQVIAMDPQAERVKVAEAYGALGVNLSAETDPILLSQELTGGQGVDAVVITAATDSNTPIEQAAAMCRKRGRIVLTGVSGLNIDRNLFYAKELSFQVSCSYGPGRYDQNYEQKGIDYPLPFVRWTQQRNFTACLQLMVDKKIKTDQLLTEKFDITDISKAYQRINSEKPPLTVLLNYPSSVNSHLKKTVQLQVVKTPQAKGPCRAAVVGVGNYSTNMIIPQLLLGQTKIVSLASQNGLNATLLAKKLGIEESTTDLNSLYTRPDINTLFIATRHNTHAKMVLEALQHKKNIFIEKPICLNTKELNQIALAYKNSSQLKFMVGYNRRFAPHIKEIKQQTIKNKKVPLFIQMNINAGFIPSDHWTQDKEIGGGRLIGEACHFIDLSRFLAGSQISNITAKSLQGSQNKEENISLTLQFKNGSLASINYFANGAKSFAKEHIQVSQGGTIYSINDFKTLETYSGAKKKKQQLKKQDKGQKEMFNQFLDSIEKNTEPLISFEEILEVASFTFKAQDQL